MSAPLAIDLFCGLGGWTDGLLAEGYRVIGYDIEEHAYGDQRYRGELVIQDVLTLHGAQFKDAALIVASPPCHEYSYMAMPWTLAKAKAAAIRADTTGAELERLNALFNACFRIQKEASIAAGRHIPLIVENVRGAIPWVGRSRYNFGSFHLWGDVPALMPQISSRTALKRQSYQRRHCTGSWFGIDMASARAGVKVPSEIGRRTDHGKGARFTSRDCGVERHDGLKNPGFGFDGRGKSFQTESVDRHVSEGRKGAGAGAEWFDQNLCQLSSKSPSRKAASAMIAKIPEPLSRHIARTFRP